MKKILLTLVFVVVSFQSYAGQGPKYKISDDIGSGFYTLHKAGNFKPSDYGVTVVNDIVRSGNEALRIEVRQGDCGRGTGFHQDCKTDRERREFNSGDSRGSKDYMTGGEHWLAWSMYFPKSHINLWPLQNTYGQFKEVDYIGDSYDPVFQTKENRSGYTLVRTIGNKGIEGYCSMGFCDRDEVLLIPKEDMIGKWNDILINVKWTKKKDGFFKVWVNNELKYNYKGRTQSKYRGVFFQWGIYRTGLTRYINYQNLNVIWDCYQSEGYTDDDNLTLYKLEHGAGAPNINHKDSIKLYKKCKEYYKPVEVPTTIVYYDEVRKGKNKESVTKGINQ